MIFPQLIVAFLVGVFYYMIAVAMTVYDGALSLIFQPIMGAIFTAIGIAICLVLGSPIRFIRPIKTWWRRYWWIPFIIGTLGFVMMIASWFPAFRVEVMDPELGYMVDSFHPVLAIGGWTISLFAALHFYPPKPYGLFRKLMPNKAVEPTSQSSAAHG